MPWSPGIICGTRTGTEKGRPLLTALRDIPSDVVAAVVAPVFTFIGVVLTLFFGPRVQWGIEKRRELRQHRRQLVANWRTMVADVSKELDRLEQAEVSYDLGDVLRILERNAAYGSVHSTYEQYSRSGVRGLKLRFTMSSLGRKLLALRQPKFSSHPERTAGGGHLPARLRITISRIGEIERWWKLHK